jgi:hypothetical protein
MSSYFRIYDLWSTYALTRLSAGSDKAAAHQACALLKIASVAELLLILR